MQTIIWSPPSASKKLVAVGDMQIVDIGLASSPGATQAGLFDAPALASDLRQEASLGTDARLVIAFPDKTCLIAPTGNSLLDYWKINSLLRLGGRPLGFLWTVPSESGEDTAIGDPFAEYIGDAQVREHMRQAARLFTQSQKH